MRPPPWFRSICSVGRWCCLRARRARGRGLACVCVGWVDAMLLSCGGRVDYSRCCGGGGGSSGSCRRLGGTELLLDCLGWADDWAGGGLIDCLFVSRVRGGRGRACFESRRWRLAGVEGELCAPAVEEMLLVVAKFDAWGISPAAIWIAVPLAWPPRWLSSVTAFPTLSLSAKCSVCSSSTLPLPIGANPVMSATAVAFLYSKLRSACHRIIACAIGASHSRIPASPGSAAGTAPHSRARMLAVSMPYNSSRLSDPTNRGECAILSIEMTSLAYRVTKAAEPSVPGRGTSDAELYSKNPARFTLWSNNTSSIDLDFRDSGGGDCASADGWKAEERVRLR
uniref:Uncharacterized protein n=1 Tax=Phyllostachys edulis TaxID=38705 RepID=D3IVN2_PHYED|nr:hypothetical protein [Phyllostachys edulis]